jgi:hypothetical protein
MNYTWIKDYKKIKDIAEPVSDSIIRESIRKSEDFQNIRNVMQKFERIEEKNRCLRVQFLDWLSAKMHAWADGVKAMSDRIDSPCIIKVEPKRKTT